VRLLLMYLEGVNDGERCLPHVRKRTSGAFPWSSQGGKKSFVRLRCEPHATLTGTMRMGRGVSSYTIISMEDAEVIVNLDSPSVPPSARAEKRCHSTTSGGAGIVLRSLQRLGFSFPALSKPRRRSATPYPSLGSSLNPGHASPGHQRSRGFPNVYGLSRFSRIDMLSRCTP
jgi:hypothetical protein